MIEIIDLIQSWAIYFLGLILVAIVFELDQIRRNLKKVKEIALGG
jgi:hypothetical protein